jgi:hypothetical protein
MARQEVLDRPKAPLLVAVLDRPTPPGGVDIAYLGNQLRAPGGPALLLPASDWQAFLTGAKAGDFNI